jgi:hypothetical protein
MASSSVVTLQRAFSRLLVILPFTTIALTLIACSTESRHRTVLYDQEWSRAAGVKNLYCAPEFRESCDLRARETEEAFSKSLSAAFRASPECANVQLLVASGSDKNFEELWRRLATDKNSQYWRLRVDFRPGLTRQPFLLGLGQNTPRTEGDDAEHEAAYICKAAKNNGVTAIW